MKPDGCMTYIFKIIAGISIWGGLFFGIASLTWNPGLGSFVYYFMLAAVGAGALYAIKQMSTSYTENALACPRCGKKNALKLHILHKENEWSETPRKTHFHSRGGNTHYSKSHKVEARVKEGCKYCTYVSSEYTINAENIYQEESDSDGQTISGINGYPDIEEVWLSKKLG